MIRKLAELLLGIILFAACGGSQTAVQSAGSMPSPLGGPCKGASECQSGLFCEKGVPGGQCLKRCTTSADCGAGAVCNDQSKCHPACQSNTDCERPGYVCAGAARARSCEAAPEDEVRKAMDQGLEYGR